MAFRVRPFYNLDKPVGRNKTNARDDVGLVQFFLNFIQKNPDVLLGSFQAPKKPLRVTGVFDDATHEWIVAFQTAIRGGFQKNLVVDGIVDPARGYSSQQTTITHATYTIALLNNAYAARNPGLHSHIWDDPDMLADVGKKVQEDAR